MKGLPSLRYAGDSGKALGKSVHTIRAAATAVTRLYTVHDLILRNAAVLCAVPFHAVFSMLAIAKTRYTSRGGRAAVLEN